VSDIPLPIILPGDAPGRLAKPPPGRESTVTIERRQAVITAVNLDANGVPATCDIIIGNSGVTVPGVAFLCMVTPNVNDVVWVDIKGDDPLIIGCQMPSAWIAPTLTNSWVNFGAPDQTARYRREPFNIVRIQGCIKNGTINTAAFTLPTGYRPQARIQSPAIDGGGTPAGRVDVTSAGLVIPTTGSTASMAFNIAFAVD